MGYQLNQPILASALCHLLNLNLVGNDANITSVSSYNAISDGSLSFYNKEICEKKGIIIAPYTTENTSHHPTAIFSKNPRLDFIRAVTYISEHIGFPHFDFQSVIHPSVQIGKNVVIEDGCVINEGTIIEHNVVIHKGTTIGKNCRIRAGSIIGGDGFGFERLPDQTPIRFPHLGGVVIYDNVEIGALNTIAKGTLSNTMIGHHVKTDNLVHIAHNCIIGNNCIITACAELSGGVVLKENVWIGPNASILQKTTVNKHAFVGIGSVVTKDVPNNTLVAGHPAKRIKEI